MTKSTDDVSQVVAKSRHAARLDERAALRPRIQRQVDPRGVPRSAKSELMTSLARFRRAGVKVRPSSGLYNNWGGMVTEQDLRGLDMAIKGEDGVHKSGACSLLFNQVQVMSTGVVNGCACRDAEGTLQIGDLRQQPLAEILSTRNDAYIQLIEEQQRGDFRPVCRSCDFYKSIYKPAIGRRRRASRLARRLQGGTEFASRHCPTGQAPGRKQPLFRLNRGLNRLNCIPGASWSHPQFVAGRSATPFMPRLPLDATRFCG